MRKQRSTCSITNMVCFVAFFLLLTINYVSAQDVDFEWGLTFQGEGGPTIGLAIVSDSIGNTYTAGHFAGNVDFDPGPDSTILSGDFNTTFILKYLKY